MDRHNIEVMKFKQDRWPHFEVFTRFIYSNRFDRISKQDRKQPVQLPRVEIKSSDVQALTFKAKKNVQIQGVGLYLALQAVGQRMPWYNMEVSYIILDAHMNPVGPL